MKMNRREMLQWMSGACSALALSKIARPQQAAANGPFLPTRESLQAYTIPDWFRDAKFGIWAHWGPQSAIEDGDWYARNMYIQGQPQYLYHCETYGHPSKVGYKDLVNLWKAEKWDPDHLMGLYKKAGAKYFFSMGVHHDNFDLWNSKYTRWNAVNMGPKKDVVGLWQRAARNHGLRFGVSEHLWISYKWFAVSHGADKTGPLAGVSYDGVDPKYADLYHDAGCVPFIDKLTWNDDGIPDSWRQHYLNRMTGPHRQVSSRHSLHRRSPSLRGIRPEDGGASLQRKRAVEWRHSRGGVYQQGGYRIARSEHAPWTMSAAWRTGSRRIPGKPTHASDNGTTSEASSTKRPRR